MDMGELKNLYAKQGLAFPETLTLALTGQCNLQCAHCWVDASPGDQTPEVAYPAVEGVIREFAAMGGSAVRLTGGEPLLYPDFLPLIRAAGEAGLRVLLQTNGMLLTRQILRELQQFARPDIHVQISLDGASAATHDLVRGEGAFARTRQGIELLVSHGFGNNVALFFTEMRHNLQELPDLLLLARRLGVASVSSGTLVTCGRASDELVAPPSPDQYLRLLERYAEDEEFQHLYQEMACVAALEWCPEKTARGGCDFIRNPYLTLQGTLYPCLLCHAADYAVQGVYQKGLKAALIDGITPWTALLRLSRQRLEAIKDCHQCHCSTSCAGGCMGRAYGSFGDFMVAEDRCRQRQAVMEWKRNRSQPQP